MSDSHEHGTVATDTHSAEQPPVEESDGQPEAQIEALTEAVRHLQARVSDLEAEIDTLQTTVETTTADVERNSQDLQEAFQTLTPMRKLLIGDGHDEPPLLVMKQLRERRGPLNQQLAELTRRLSKRDAAVTEQVKREVGILRSEQNAKFHQLTTEAESRLETASEDILTRVREDGIDAVRAAPRKRDRRAAYVLQHIEEWGTKEQLRSGAAYRLPRPRVQRLLNATDDVSVQMTSKTVGDVFDAIEELAAGSPRFVQRRKHDGVDNLYVGFPETSPSR